MKTRHKRKHIRTRRKHYRRLVSFMKQGLSIDKIREYYSSTAALMRCIAAGTPDELGVDPPIDALFDMNGSGRMAVVSSVARNRNGKAWVYALTGLDFGPRPGRRRDCK